MTNIEQLIEKWDNNIEEYDNAGGGICVDLITEFIQDLKSIEQPNVDSIMEDIKLEIGYNKNDHTIDDDYDKGYRAGLMKAKTICKEYKLKHLTSKAPKLEVKVDKVVERFKDNGSMYYDNMWK